MHTKPQNAIWLKHSLIHVHNVSFGCALPWQAATKRRSLGGTVQAHLSVWID